MRRRSDDDEPVGRFEAVRPDPWIGHSRWRANGWPVLPLRLFLAALFCFAGYAKFSYPGFFDPNSRNGFKSAVDAARNGDTPIGGALGPLSDHASLFGHLTAYAEIAIGLGLLVGLLTRLAALGGMALTTLIVLSINWNGVKEYTGSSGWFTSVELALAAALSVFLLGGPGPLALDNLFIRARERQRARDDAEPSFRESEIEDSRRRLQGEPVPAGDAATTQLPAGHTATTRLPADDAATTQLPAGHYSGGGHPGYAGKTGQLQDEEYRDDPEPEPNSLWTEGRRAPGQPPAGESRRDG
ncbi:DoxX family protein [Jatrophihabitans sp.]|uniref:DoxX family protein n=1 Tax=Jatrophihabitans sp. TaxID=1932789 RepID=UPI002D10F038|nr:DoxX family protein [Jatrophihabitans sp.]